MYYLYKKKGKFLLLTIILLKLIVIFSIL